MPHEFSNLDYYAVLLCIGSGLLCGVFALGLLLAGLARRPRRKLSSAVGAIAAGFAAALTGIAMIGAYASWDGSERPSSAAVTATRVAACISLATLSVLTARRAARALGAPPNPDDEDRISPHG